MTVARALLGEEKNALGQSQAQAIRWWMEVIQLDVLNTTGPSNWVTKLSACVRVLQMDDWQILARDTTLWFHLTEALIQFCKR